MISTYHKTFSQAYDLCTKPKNPFEKDLVVLGLNGDIFHLQDLKSLQFLVDTDWEDFIKELTEVHPEQVEIAQSIIQNLHKELKRQHDIEGVSPIDFWKVADHLFQLMILTADPTDKYYMGLLYSRYRWLMQDRLKTSLLYKCFLEDALALPKVVPGYAYEYLNKTTEGQKEMNEILDSYRLRFQKTPMGYTLVSASEDEKEKFLETVSKNLSHLEEIFTYSPYYTSPSGLLTLPKEVLTLKEFKEYMENLPTLAYLDIVQELLVGNEPYRTAYQDLDHDMAHLLDRKTFCSAKLLDIFLDLPDRSALPILVQNTQTCRLEMLDVMDAYVYGGDGFFSYYGKIRLIFVPNSAVVLDFKPVELEYKGHINSSYTTTDIHKQILNDLKKLKFKLV